MSFEFLREEVLECFCLLRFVGCDGCVPSPVEKVRLSPSGAHDEWMLVDVVVQGCGSTLLGAEYHEGGCGSGSIVLEAVDGASGLEECFAGRESYPFGYVKGGIDVVEYEVYAVVCGMAVGDGMLGLIVHLEYVSGKTVYAVHGVEGGSASKDDL